MDASYYGTIFKRKSFHLFRNVGSNQVTIQELEEIHRAHQKFKLVFTYNFRNGNETVSRKDIELALSSQSSDVADAASPKWGC